MLAIALDLNVKYSILRSLISFQEAPWQGLVYYVGAITTNWRCLCATFIKFTTYKVTVSYQYMSSVCYREIHLLRFMCSCCNLIYNECINLLCLVINHHTTLLIKKFRINLFVIFCNTIFRFRQVHVRPFESFNHQHKVNIKRRDLSGVGWSLWGRTRLWFKLSGYSDS